MLIMVFSSSLAWMELRLTLAHIFRRFDMVPSPDWYVQSFPILLLTPGMTSCLAAMLSRLSSNFTSLIYRSTLHPYFLNYFCTTFIIVLSPLTNYFSCLSLYSRAL